VYVPPRYALTSDEAWSVVLDAGAGFLIAATAKGLRSVFAPVLVSDDRSVVRAHVSRGNPFWRDGADGDDVSALFRAADTYISPGLDPGKLSDPRVAPTWDYEVVEVRGRLRVRDDADFVEAVVRDLTARHEGRREDPWSVDDAPADFTAGLVRGIVGLEIAVEQVTGAAKLSQNKDEVDRAAVAASLANGTDRERAVAARMEGRA
jgi:transcriptional regulator